MALHEASRPVVANSGIGARLNKITTSVVAFLVAWNEARITRSELSKLSDHQLEDLGISRGEIDGLFR